MGIWESTVEGMVANSGNNMNFWRKKKVLLTGHTGFKGSWLSTWLKSLGADLIGYSLNPPTEINLFDIANVRDGIISIKGDILDFEHFEKVIKEHKPEIIIHMAAQSLVHRSYSEPRETFATNVIGTVNLFEAIRQAGNVRVVINITSDKCYENKEKEKGYNENDALGGYDPYSASKACAELVTSAFRSSFFNPDYLSKHNALVASARAGNVIGGGDWAPNRLIPDIVRAIFNSQTLVIRCPKAVRPWQHVLEPLGGYLLLAQKLWEEGPKYAEAWNFGPEDSDIKSVQWILEQFIKLWDEKVNYVINSSEKLYETQFLKLDCTKAKSRLGWTPIWNINKALEKTVDWYRSLKEKKDMSKYTLSQIKEYEKELALSSKNLLNI